MESEGTPDSQSNLEEEKIRRTQTPCTPLVALEGNSQVISCICSGF